MAVFEKPSHDHDHDDHDEDHDDNDDNDNDDDSDEDEDMPSTTLIGTSFTARESTSGRVSWSMLELVFQVHSPRVLGVLPIESLLSKVSYAIVYQ